MKSNKKFLLLDANALLHRAYHALPPLTSPEGEPAGALYGLSLTLINVLNTFHPTYTAAAFDRPEKTFRHDLYEAYKGKREKADDELVSQIVRAGDVFSAFGIKVLSSKGYEADDVIGTLASMATKEKLDTVIVTGDADALQLVDKNVRVHMLRRGVKDTVTMNPSDVKEKYGLPPELMIDYKALRGDPSDNIPGVRGIGEKTARDLLRTYGSLEKIYQNLSELPARTKKLLEEGKKDAFESRTLVEIVCDIELETSINELQWNGVDRPAAVSLFRELGFTSLIKRLPGVSSTQGSLLSPSPSSGKKHDEAYTLIHSEDEAKALITKLRGSEGFVIDTETDNINARLANVIGISVSFQPKEAYYVPVSHVPLFADILEDATIPKWGHNLKYDSKVLSRMGIQLNPAAFDSMLASYILSPGTRAHGLDTLALTVLGHEMIPIEALIGKAGKAQKNLSEVSVEKVAQYACEDADYTLRLVQHFSKELKNYPSLLRVFNEIEMPLVPVLVHMESVGVRVEKNVLAKLSKKIGTKLRSLEKKIHDEAGDSFNINSPSQLGEVLYEKLGLSTTGIGRTQTGHSTAAGELEKLQGKHPIIPHLMEYRELAKLKNTYTDALQELIDPATHRIYTSYNQTVTATGRLSSSEPNLQNIPIRSEFGKELRYAFVAEKGMRLVAFDYSQIELRIIAHLSNDRAMTQAFVDNKDIHTETAAAVLGISSDVVTKDQRHIAKELNFGILYGMGASSFAAASGISVEKARSFIDEYMRTYSGVTEYMKQQKEFAASEGYVETLYGRRRYLPEATSSNPRIRAGAERMAINHPAQGTGSDIIKRAMADIYRNIAHGKKPYNGARMVLQIHDELVFEVPEQNVEVFADDVRKRMEGIEQLRVPLVVDVSSGQSWGEMKAL